MQTSNTGTAAAHIKDGLFTMKLEMKKRFKYWIKTTVEIRVDITVIRECHLILLPFPLRSKPSAVWTKFFLRQTLYRGDLVVISAIYAGVSKHNCRQATAGGLF